MSDVVKPLRRATRSLQKPIEKKITGALEKPFRTGASAAQRTVAQETERAKQREQKKLLEAEDEIARRRTGARSGGRGSLIRTSPTGLATNLGGT